MNKSDFLLVINNSEGQFRTKKGNAKYYFE